MAWYTVKTYYKKSCEQHEHFYNRNIKGASIIVKDGFRFAELKESKTPGFDDTKIIKVYVGGMDPTYQGETSRD